MNAPYKLGLFASSILLTGFSSAAVFAADHAADRAPEKGRVIQSADQFSVLKHRDRIAPENAMVNERLGTLLPELMAKAFRLCWSKARTLTARE